MGTRIASESRRALDEKVNVGFEEISKHIEGIAEALGSYGFKGEIVVTVTVTTRDEALGGDAVKIKRETALPFRR